jgi:hypothetical protein
MFSSCEEISIASALLEAFANYLDWFGFRVSDFFRFSAFGFRISGSTGLVRVYS